jgi:hypothetical protein
LIQRLRAAAALLVAAFAWLGGPSSAHAGEGEPTVLLLPLESKGLSKADHATLEAGLRPAFEHPGLEVVSEPASAESCSDDACRRELGRERGASHVIRVELAAEGRDFVAQIEVLAVDGTGPPTTIDASCLVCGLSEFDELLAGRAVSARELILTPVAAQTGRLRVIGGPVDARVSVDGFLLGRLPYEGELAPGRHELVVTAAGHVRRVVPFVTVAGAEELIEVKLEPKPVPRWRRPLGWSLIAASAGSLGAGAALIGVDGRDAAHRCRSGEAGVIDLDGNCRWIHQSMGAGVGLTIVGIAAAAAGATLLIIDARQRRARNLAGPKPELAPQVRLGVGLGRLDLHIRF